MTELRATKAPGFTWGVATASYQIEGGASAGGRGEGGWDAFSRRPGAIYRGHTGLAACDHYGRWGEDLDLLAELGVDAYRFGISWPRVMPRGIGSVNEEGLAFYDRLVDGLLERNVTPYVTLFHWDLPQALELLGGFRNPAMPEWFGEFTRVVAARIGDRVRHYFTLNEPHAPIEGGLREGRHAPGHRLPLGEVLLAGHRALLAHGRAVEVLRAEIKDSWVAMAPVLICAVPASNSQQDVEAARRSTFSVPAPRLRLSSWWMDPAWGRGYPEDGLRQFGREMPAFPASDLERIAQPLDAVGFNLYDAVTVQANAQGEPIVVDEPPGRPRTAFNWPITPEAHYWGPRFCSERYGQPSVITENGLSCRDWVHLDGQVHDPDRIDFMKRHLHFAEQARNEQHLCGYFHWSLLDNFEWNHGYRERFGLVHVDYATLRRTKKDSFFEYARIISEDRHSTRN